MYQLTPIKMKIFLLNQEDYIAPTESDEYIRNVLLEDQLISEALTKLGADVQRVAWTDSSVDWASGDAAIFRATWDYFERYTEFKEWLDSTERKIRLINPVQTIRWNMDKRYMADLEKKGIVIVPTTFVHEGDKRELGEIVADQPWEEMIIKPAVGGGARHTHRMNAATCESLAPMHAELIENEAMMIQPFIENVIEAGEVSYMCFGGKYSHAILKRAKPGDFRVQDTSAERSISLVDL